MSKKNECFTIFDAHSEAKRERAIELAMSQAAVTRTTANTYYPAWRKEFMSKLSYIAPEKIKKEKQERVRNITKNTDSVTKMANKITEVTEKSPIKAIDIPESKPTVDEAVQVLINEKLIKVEGINWKVDSINSVKTVEKNVDVFEVTRLIPVIMSGKHGIYKFDKDGVKATLNEDCISKDKMDEALEALEIWERCYGKDGIQSC